MSDFQLAFEITGSCHQVISPLTRIGYDEDSIIKGLKDGTLETTTSHDQNEGFTWIVVAETGQYIAMIIQQEINGELYNFR